MTTNRRHKMDRAAEALKRRTAGKNIEGNFSAKYQRYSYTRELDIYGKRILI
jgi:hypothetical protein